VPSRVISQKAAVSVVYAGAMFIVVMDQTIVNVALAAIASPRPTRRPGRPGGRDGNVPGLLTSTAGWPWDTKTRRYGSVQWVVHLDWTAPWPTFPAPTVN
jgi:hypothetical protein